MAATVARFSIREYAARARPERASWPFGGEPGTLPPMEVRWFRWWKDEAAAVEEEEREVERRMAAKRRKRSVAELFAVVPRVAGGKGKRPKNGMQAKGKGKVVLAVEVKAASKGLKKKKVQTGIGARTKEKGSSIKVTSISIPPMFEDSIRKRKLTKCLGKNKRNQEPSVLTDRESKKQKKTSVSDSKKKVITVVQTQSILHKQSKVGFSTLTDNADATCNIKSSCKPKHVTFSLDTFGWSAPLPESNAEQAQSLQTSKQLSQKRHDQHSGDDELQLVDQQADAIPGAIEEDTSSLSEIVVSNGVFCILPVSKPKEMTTMGNPVDRNQCTEIFNCSNYLKLACLPRKMPSQPFEDLGSHLNNNEDFSLDADCLDEENHTIQQGSSNPVSLEVKATSGDSYRNMLSQPSGFCLVDRGRIMLPERMLGNHHLGGFHHKFVSSGKDSVNSTSSSAGSKKSSDARATDCIPVCSNEYFGNDYAGLPLNSRGEFVKLQPGGTSSSIYISKRQCLGESSSRPPAFPAFYTPITCTDHVNLRSSHLVPNTIDQSPHFTPTSLAEDEMHFRQLPCSKRMETHKYTNLSNKRPCTNQQEPSAVSFYYECMGRPNPPQKIHGEQSCFMQQDCEQNNQSTSESTMRLMGKTVTLGTSSIQFTDLNIENPESCKQTQAECRKAFPQLLHWDLGGPSSASRILHGERELSENPYFHSASELRSELDMNSFRINGCSQRPEPPAPNDLYVQPTTWCNEFELRHQPPVMPNQAQSSAEDMLPVSMHLRNTQNVGTVPCFNSRRNSIRNFMEKRPVPYQPSCFPQKFSNMTQRNPVSSSLSGHAAVQSTPGLTSQTKFTSLPPLPPSLPPSHVRSLDYAQHRHTNSTPTFRPTVPAVYQTSRSSALGNAISRVEGLKWAVMGSNVEDWGHMNGNGKRPAENDGALLTSPKKPCTAAQKDDLSLFPVPEMGLQLGRSRPDAARSVDMPVGFGPEPQPDLLRLGSGDAHRTWSYPVSTVSPVKLKSGARHMFEPSGSREQGISWTTSSVTPFAVENAACTTERAPQKSTNPNQSW